MSGVARSVGSRSAARETASRGCLGHAYSLISKKVHIRFVRRHLRTSFLLRLLMRHHFCQSADGEGQALSDPLSLPFFNSVSFDQE